MIQLKSLLVVLALLFPPIAQAQSGGRDASFADPETTFDITFPGGSLDAFVEAIRRAAPHSAANIVISGETDDLVLPQIELKQVEVGSASHMLEVLLLPNHDVRVRDVLANGSLPIYVIGVERRTGFAGESRSSRPQPRTTDVFSLRSLVSVPPGIPVDSGNLLTTETVLSAVETTLALESGDDQAELRYHPDTQVLVIQGSPRQTEIVASLLATLDHELNQRRHDVARAASEIADVQAALEQAEIAARKQENRMHTAMTRFEEAKRLAERELVSQAELEQSAAELRDAELGIAASRVEIDRQKQRLEILQAAMDATAATSVRTPIPDSPSAIQARIAALEDELAVLKRKLATMENAR